MGRFGTAVTFEVDGIWCEDEVLGQSVTCVRGDVGLRVDIPDSPDAFDFMTVSGVADTDPRNYSDTPCLIESGTGAEVRVLRVVANVDAELDSLDEPGAEDVLGERASTLSEKPADGDVTDLDPGGVRARLVRASEEVVRDFCNWTRVVGGQKFMQPPGSYPRQIGASQLFDITDAENVRGSRTMAIAVGSVVVLPADYMLDTDRFEQVAARVQSGSPRPEEVLLADAEHLLTSEDEQGPSLSVLLAAVAIEVMTKQALRYHAAPEQLSLVELLAENPRDWSLSAHATFKDAIPAVVAMDDELESRWNSCAKRVQKLFETRNKVAHRGDQVTRDDAEIHVRTASDAAALLSELHQATPNESET